MITSSDNKTIKRIVKLSEKAKERREQGVFVVEGPRMAIETPAELVEAVFVSESFASQWDTMLTEEARERFAKVTELVSDSVMKQMSDTMTPQGVLAIVKQPKYELAEILGKPNPYILIIENVQDPGNLGTMFRTAEGAGIRGILMNKTTVDLFNPKTVRATMGSLYRVPFVIANEFEPALCQVKNAGITMYAAHLRGERTYDTFDYTKPCAFLIGNEGNGLTHETAAFADELLKIPMEGELESLNAAMAAGILMYEVHRQRG